MTPDEYMAMTPLKQRIYLTARGFHIFPLIPGQKTPANSNGFKGATNNTDAALSWPSDDHGVGIATGASGLLVIDCDNHGGTPAPPWDLPGITTGEDALAVLWNKQAPGTSPWAEAPSVATPSGGVHLYYRDPTGGKLRNSAGRLAWQVDTRANGGYVVAPGTVLEDGGAYRPIHWPHTTPDAPQWLVETLTAPPRPTRTPGAYKAPEGPISDRAVLGLLKTVAEAPAGKRNDLLNWAAWKLAEGDRWTEDNVEALGRAAEAAGLTPDEIVKTLASASRKNRNTNQ